MSNFDVDLITWPRRAARTAWIVAGIAIFVAVALAGVLLVSLPLRQTEVFTVLVDSSTGAAERIYQVEPTTLSDQEAVRDALLVGYITDRESYFRAGIQDRLERVQRMSRDQARRSLTALWTRGSANYPPDLYGVQSEIRVRIIAITFLDRSVAQVRFEKQLMHPQKAPVTQTFIATVGFDFEPRRERSQKRVWENPMGFLVTDYRVDAETLIKE